MNVITELRKAKKVSLKALRAFNAFALIVSFLVSPHTNAIQIRLGSAMNVRSVDDMELVRVGVLAAGSVVEVPDKYKVLGRDGKVDGTATFNNWLTRANYASTDISKPVTDPKLDFYFPIKIVSMARGSRGGASLIGTTQYMALRVLDRSSGGMRVIQDAPIYAGPENDSPLMPVAPASLAPAAPSTSEAAAPCLDCHAGRAETPAPAVQNQAASVASAIQDDYLPQTFQQEADSNNFPALTRGFSGVCNAFIDEDGSYGPTGLEVLRQISEVPAYMSNSNGVSAEACPRFRSFSDAQKRNFWVWTFAAIARQESTCNPRARTSPDFPTPNGPAVGLFQIEERAGLRRGRDSTYGGNYCAGPDARNVRLNTRCAVHMLAPLLRSGVGPYSTRNQYWAVLKFNRTMTKRLISQYSACHTGATR